MSEEHFCGADDIVLAGNESKIAGDKACDSGAGDRRNEVVTYEQVFEERTSIAVIPLGPRIIVRKIKETGISEGGIVVPEHRIDPRKREITLSRGRVVSKGDLKEVSIDVGMLVIYADQTAIELKLGGITYGDVLYEDDVIAIIGEQQ